MATTTAAVPGTPQPIGAFSRVIGALFNPRPTFEDIARKPSWIVPMLILIVLNVGITTVFSQRVGWRAFMEQQIEKSRSAQQRMSQLSPEQRESTLETQAKVANVFGYVGGIVGVPVILMIIGAIFMGIFNATSSAQLDLNTSMSVAAHAYLPFAIFSLLGLLVLSIKPRDAIDLQNLVASNPGALLGSSAPQWLKSLCSSLDVFTFWVLGLMAFGYSVVRPKKIKMGSALTWIVGIWIAFVLIKVGFAALTS
ncbi:MAG TPA: YIP1 family protein [Verrucomicrobiae bacterium]|nr:YIP1 family protein [Verrucomicrobiae bacterium]